MIPVRDRVKQLPSEKKKPCGIVPFVVCVVLGVIMLGIGVIL